MQFWQILIRCCRLRCPRCGRGRLFQKLWRMQERCQHCGLLYQREPGFFLGAIYFNYGLTALISVISYPVMVFALGIPKKASLMILLAFVVIFPLWYFRYARSLWLGFDQYIDPRSD